MTKLRENALSLLEKIPEDKLVFLIQIMEGVAGLYKKNESQCETAFQTLERLRKKEPFNLDYEAELASYREEKYGVTSVD